MPAPAIWKISIMPEMNNSLFAIQIKRKKENDN